MILKISLIVSQTSLGWVRTDLKWLGQLGRGIYKKRHFFVTIFSIFSCFFAKNEIFSWFFYLYLTSTLFKSEFFLYQEDNSEHFSCLWIGCNIFGSQMAFFFKKKMLPRILRKFSSMLQQQEIFFLQTLYCRL